jgi:hypothetical protein
MASSVWVELRSSASIVFAPDPKAMIFADPSARNDINEISKVVRQTSTLQGRSVRALSAAAAQTTASNAADVLRRWAKLMHVDISVLEVCEHVSGLGS